MPDFLFEIQITNDDDTLAPPITVDVTGKPNRAQARAEAIQFAQDFAAKYVTPGRTLKAVVANDKVRS